MTPTVKFTPLSVYVMEMKFQLYLLCIMSGLWLAALHTNGHYFISLTFKTSLLYFFISCSGLLVWFALSHVLTERNLSKKSSGKHSYVPKGVIMSSIVITNIDIMLVLLYNCCDLPFWCSARTSLNVNIKNYFIYLYAPPHTYDVFCHHDFIHDISSL